MVKAWISWVVSSLLVFQPSAWALSGDNSQNVKKFLELTQITRHEVSAKELYEKTQKGLPENFRKEFKAFVDANPNFKLPKIAVSKVPGANKEEDIQLQFVNKGESAIITLVGRGDVFAKVGKQTITYQDMANSGVAMAKFEQAIPPKSSARNPSAIHQTPVLLKAKDILKLDKNSQRKYFKNLRDLMDSMEEVQNAVISRKTSSVDKTQLEYFASLFLLPEAQAADVGGVGTVCIVGGWPSTFSKDETGKLSCGHTDSTISQGCQNSHQVQCNPALYGSRAEGTLCVQPGYDTTSKCNEAASQQDIPDLAKNSQELDQLTSKAAQQAASLQHVCDALYNENSSSDQKFKNKFNDQVKTCGDLEARIVEINKWPCSNPAFKSNKNYQRLCVACGATDGPGTPTTPPVDDGGGTSTTPPPASAVNGCDPSMFIIAGDSRSCHPSQTEVSSFCTSAKGEHIAATSCECDSQAQAVGKVCASSAGTDPGTSDRHAPKKSSFWQRHGKTLMYFGAGLVGLLVYNWAVKDATKKQYQQMLPPPSNPPVPVPEPAPTPPPPRPGVS